MTLNKLVQRGNSNQGWTFSTKRFKITNTKRGERASCNKIGHQSKPQRALKSLLSKSSRIMSSKKELRALKQRRNFVRSGTSLNVRGPHSLWRKSKSNRESSTTSWKRKDRTYLSLSTKSDTKQWHRRFVRTKANLRESRQIRAYLWTIASNKTKSASDK